MKIIHLNSHNVYFNLAAEEFIFRQVADTEPCLLLWQNDNAVVIGKHQNTVEEVNLDFADSNHVRVARRISGGGAVYHDLGNLNYSIIDYSEAMRWDIKRMAEPVVAALRRMGIDVEVNDRNDLLIAGRKISGSSQYIRRDHLLHHGTLLFNADLDKLSRSLKPDYDHIESRSRKSVRSPVTNIQEHNPAVAIPDFIAALTEVLKESSEVNICTLTDHDSAAINKLRDEKYSTWEWVHARSPAYTITKHRLLNGQTVEINMAVKDGIIQSLNIKNGFDLVKEFETIGKTLVGQRLRKEDLSQAIEKTNNQKNIVGVSSQDLTNALIS